METEEFDINENTTVEFNTMYGVTDSLKTKASLKEGKEIIFKLVLVDARTDKIIGIYQKEKIDKNSDFSYKSGSYIINTEGLINPYANIYRVWQSTYKFSIRLSFG